MNKTYLYDSRCKISVSIGRHDQTKVHETTEEELEVFETIEDITGCDSSLESSVALIFL